MDSIELPWLPVAPPDFRQQVQALRSRAEATPWPSEALQALATHRLNVTQLTSLARAAGEPPQPLRLALLSNASTELLGPCVQATALRHGLALSVQTVPFGMFAQEALSPDSEVRQRANHFVLLALDHRAFDFHPRPGDETGAQAAVDAALNMVTTLANGLRDSGATVIWQTLVAPPDVLFGSLELNVPGTMAWQVERFNTGLRSMRQPGTLLLDLAALAARIGSERWHDATQWALGKFAFAHAALPLYADHVARLMAAARGRSRKCLVLDLDNTLWGGVIGDDGMSGIVLGQGSPAGEAFLNTQATALALRERGIVLAVSSKNEESIARQVFKEHPDMLLREEHIAVFQANWKDKATNLRAIAETLNIGLDALVFLDDNPAERQQVRMALPMVAVPEMPEAAEEFAATLLAAGYFEAVQFTQDDRDRAAQYQANAARSASIGAGGDLQAYLASLQMEIEFAPFDDLGRARITQLVNKTNQFNLRTQRYSEAEIEGFAQDPAALTLQVRLRDRFGDMGMISVVICRPHSPGAWFVDTWLMSCRVLKRGVERAVLDEIVRCAGERGIMQLDAEYLPTEKNALVRDHYADLGFTCTQQDESGASRWTLSVSAHQPQALPIRVVR